MMFKVTGNVATPSLSSVSLADIHTFLVLPSTPIELSQPPLTQADPLHVLCILVAEGDRSSQQESPQSPRLKFSPVHLLLFLTSLQHTKCFTSFLAMGVPVKVLSGTSLQLLLLERNHWNSAVTTQRRDRDSNKVCMLTFLVF